MKTKHSADQAVTAADGRNGKHLDNSFLAQYPADTRLDDSADPIIAGSWQ
ncbi:MAG: hypothetical protein ACYS8X_04305 [Planctomycetota bacterium]|jgi:hypothetical protein